MKYTRQEAINKNCEDCIYDSLDKGTKNAQIEACTQSDCPFYEYRPLTAATKGKNKEKRINAMTHEERAAHDRKVELARERFTGIINRKEA